MNDDEIFKIVDEHSFTSDKCFLCGCILNEENKTEEHVIPKWLQNKYNLWDQLLTVLNGTDLPYRYLTIPCCRECNNIHLKPFEDKICEAQNNGFDSFIKLDKEIIYLWLSKIFFGVMYKNLFLDVSRKEPTKGKIIPPKYLKHFNTHLLFLQGIRGRHKFIDFFPGSIFIFKTQLPNNIERQWDYMDNHYAMLISMRLGEIGVIAVLQDGNTLSDYSNDLEKHRKIDLHPLQFRELTAKVLYKAILFNRSPKFMAVQNKGIVQSYMNPIAGYTGEKIFNKWDNFEYTKLLSYYLGIELNSISEEQYFTCLVDENMNPQFMDVNENPY